MVPPPVAGIVTRIHGLLPDLRPAERRIADAILADPSATARETITALAERCGTSAPTIVRFSRRLGFSGYPQLRLELAKEAGMAEGQRERAPLSDTLVPGDSVAEMVAKIRGANMHAVEATASTLEVDDLQRAADLIAQARRIDLLGIGGSAVATLDLYQKLARLGLQVTRHEERHGAMTALSLRGEGDVVIAVSHTGTTTDVIAPAMAAKERGATVIAITNHPASTLAKGVDISLITASHEKALRSGAMASRTAQLMVVDCLFAAVALRDMDETQARLDTSFRAVAGL